MHSQTHKLLSIIGICLFVVAIAYLLGVQAGHFLGISKNDAGPPDRESIQKQILTQMNSINIGDTLPDFAFDDLDLNLHQLSELIDGPTVITIIKPDCGACIKQISNMKSTVTNNDDFRRFIMISWSNPLLLKDFVETHKLKNMVLYDEDRMLRDNLHIGTSPFNIVLNGSLVIERIVVGALSTDEIKSIIESNDEA